MENASTPLNPATPPTTAAHPSETPKKKRGIFKWVLLVLVLLIVAGLVVLYLNLNGIIHRTVESESTASLNVPTDLGGVNLGLFGGTLSMHDFVVSSPEGFSAPQMLSLGNLDVAVSYGDLRDDPVKVQSIRIDAPKLVIEQSGGKFNFQALMNTQSAPPPNEEGEPLKLVIEQLAITNAEVVLRPGIPGLAEEITVPIPAVEIQNIGSGEGNQNGAALKEVAMTVITTLVAKASESDKVPAELRQLLQMDVNQIADQLGGMVDEQVQDLTNQAREELNENLKDLPPAATQGIEGILDRTEGATTKPGSAVEKGVKDVLGGLRKKAE